MKIEQLTHLASHFLDYVQWTPLLKFAVATILFNPIFWNIVARLEHRTHFLTKLAGGAYNGCYLLAATIFLLGIYRDHVYHGALLAQPTYLPMVESGLVKALAVAAFGVGNVLVVNVGIGRDGNVFGRLLWHFDEGTRDVFPLQCE